MMIHYITHRLTVCVHDFLAHIVWLERDATMTQSSIRQTLVPCARCGLRTRVVAEHPPTNRSSIFELSILLFCTCICIHVAFECVSENVRGSWQCRRSFFHEVHLHENNVKGLVRLRPA